MSIAQKGPTTWLPRFWRPSKAAVVGNGIDERAVNATDADTRIHQTGPTAADARPLDDRSPADIHAANEARIAAQAAAATANAHAAVSATPRIHPLACVDRRAQIADDVEIGPFCVIGPEVVLGRGTRLMNNVTIMGRTTVGASNLFFPNCVIGAQPQDKKFKGEDTRLEIGDNNHFREAVTIHVGTGKGGGLTKVGNGNLLMVNVHLGHDVVLGDNCIFANNVMLAGHVHVGNGVVLSGAAGIHHFVTVGDFAYAGGQARISHDVPPFVKIDETGTVRGVNTVGLRRNGFTEADVEAVEQTIWKLFLGRDREPQNVALRKFRNGGYPDLISNRHVERVIAFLERRNLGRHGRYLESLRAG